MKIFISWSGERSKLIADALREWLPNVIQALDPWMSAIDIEKGARWSSDIAAQLEKTSVGVICLTSDNLEAPWIHFEAGALSKTLIKAFVCPYLFGVEPADLKGPLVQFQATRANKQETRELLLTINRAQGELALAVDKINKAFDIWWPDLEARLQAIPNKQEEQSSGRPEREILEELLDLARAQIRDKQVLSQQSTLESRMQAAQEAFNVTPEQARDLVVSMNRTSHMQTTKGQTKSVNTEPLPQSKSCPDCGGIMHLDYYGTHYNCSNCRIL
jgi:TIR domain